MREGKNEKFTEKKIKKVLTSSKNNAIINTENESEVINMRSLVYTVSSNGFTYRTSILTNAKEISAKIGVPYSISLETPTQPKQYNAKRIEAIRAKARA